MQDKEKDQPAGSTGSKTGGTGEEAPAGTQGQHWRGEPWAKNPKVGGKEKTGAETEEGTSGQHWRGEEMPSEKQEGAGRGRAGTGRQATGPEQPDRPDEC